MSIGYSANGPSASPTGRASVSGVSPRTPADQAAYAGSSWANASSAEPAYPKVSYATCGPPKWEWARAPRTPTIT